MKCNALIVAILAFSILPCFPQHPSYLEFTDERDAMVKEIEHYPSIHITDRMVLGAMRRVPRHAFVPAGIVKYAYINRPLPIGYDQTISQPVIVASMTELLDLSGDERVLEIGTGSGYQAAVLGELTSAVYTIEIIEELGMRSKALLNALGYENVHVRTGDGYLGWPEAAPFDRIIVTCAPEDVPQPLVDQLKPGGKMVIPVGKSTDIQYLVVLTKKANGKLLQEIKYPVRFVPMTRKAAAMPSE